MKNRLKLSIFVCLAVTILSCTKNDGKSYSGEKYLNFVKNYKTDSTLFSFAYGDEIDGVVELEMEIASTLDDQGREYRVVFLPNESSAKEGVHFDKLPESLIFRGNQAVDTLQIHVNKTPDLAQTEVCAVFEVRANANFLPGVVTNQKARVYITNKLSQPTWWNDWHVKNGLGIYSEKKYRLLIELTGEYDLDHEKRPDLDYSGMRSLVLQLKYYVLDNNILEENGNPMKIVMRG